MKIYWTPEENEAMRAKCRELMALHPGERLFRIVSTAQREVLPSDRWRPFKGDGDVPLPLKDLFGLEVRGQPAGPAPAEERPLIERLAKDVAADRVKFPAAPLVDLYNASRERLAPRLPQVSHERYLPAGFLDALLSELDHMTRPAPLEGSPLLGCLREFVRSECAKAMERAQPWQEPAAAEPLLGAADLAKFRRELEDFVLSLLEKGQSPAKTEPAPLEPQPVPAAPMGLAEVPPVQPGTLQLTTLRPVEPPPVKGPMFTVRRMKLGIVDSRARHWESDIARAVPDFVKLIFEDCDHNPPATPGHRDFVIICNGRCPALWYRTYALSIPAQRLFKLEQPGKETYIKFINNVAATWATDKNNQQ